MYYYQYWEYWYWPALPFNKGEVADFNAVIPYYTKNRIRKIYSPENNKTILLQIQPYTARNRARVLQWQRQTFYPLGHSNSPDTSSDLWFELIEVSKQLVNVGVMLWHNFTNVPVHCRHSINHVEEIERMSRYAEVDRISNIRGGANSLKNGKS